MGDSRGRSRRAGRSPRSGSTCGTGARSARRPTSGPRGGRRSSNSWRSTRDDPHPRVPIPQGQVRGLRQRAGRLRPPLERRPVPGVRGDPREADGGEGRDPRRGPGGRGVKAGQRGKFLEWKNEQEAGQLRALLAERLGKPVGALWQEFGCKLPDTFGTLCRAFEGCVMGENALAAEGFKGDWVPAFIQVAKENIVPPAVTIDGYVELTNFRPDGAVHIKDALTKAVKEDHVTAKGQYIGAPRYRLVVRAPDYKTAEEEIQKAAARILKHLEAKGGTGKFVRKE